MSTDPSIVDLFVAAQREPEYRIEQCWACYGSGGVEVGIDALGMGRMQRCCQCGGSGRIHIEEKA